MANNFGLFFTRDNTVIRLPVNPEKLPVARDNANDDYNVLSVGPIMVPRDPKLEVVTISSFFPGRVFSGVLTPNEFKEPEFYIDFFKSAMTDKVPILYTPVRYYEDGTPFATGDTGYYVLVTKFDTEERGGETGDFYYDLELTEYRDYAPLKVSTLTTGDTTTATVEPSRSIPEGQLYVGCACVANGKYYASSYGDSPYGTASNRSVLISRIVDLTRAYPYHITTESGGALGWISADALKVSS